MDLFWKWPQYEYNKFESVFLTPTLRQCSWQIPQEVSSCWVCKVLYVYSCHEIDLSYTRILVSKVLNCYVAFTQVFIAYSRIEITGKFHACSQVKLSLWCTLSLTFKSPWIILLFCNDEIITNFLISYCYVQEIFYVLQSKNDSIPIIVLKHEHTYIQT
jgi:hypothetical protein